MSDAAERPGPGCCDVCRNESSERWPFLVQVKSVGMTVGARNTVLTNLAAAHCDACASYFDVFRTRRLAAIATMVLATLAFVPSMGLASAVVGRAAGVVAIALVAVPVVLTLLRVARWHDELREKLGDELLDELARGLPDAPGVLEWSEVRVFPGWPKGVEIHHSLAALRRRGASIRQRPN